MQILEWLKLGRPTFPSAEDAVEKWEPLESGTETMKALWPFLKMLNSYQPYILPSHPEVFAQEAMQACIYAEMCTWIFTFCELQYFVISNYTSVKLL